VGGFLETTFFCYLSYPGLGQFPHGEEHALQYVLRKSPQEEGLVLVRVGSGGDVVMPVDEAPAYIVSGGEVINPHFIGYFLQKRPFQVIIA
jgi:hypothetical protein